MTKLIILPIFFALAVSRISFPQTRASNSQTDFVVLDSDAHTTETQRECGSSGGFGQGLCDGMKSKAISRTYHRAMVVDAGRVHGYLVECQDRLLPRCEPLTAGEKVRGYVQSGKLILVVDGKSRTYRILKSEYDPAAEKKPNQSDGVSNGPK